MKKKFPGDHPNIDLFKLPEQERLAYARYQDDLHYQASMVESSYTVGMMKGEQKGRTERNLEIARSLLAVDQLDTATIAKVTGLPVEDVETMRQETAGRQNAMP